jgi:hypothetical protein
LEERKKLSNFASSINKQKDEKITRSYVAGDAFSHLSSGQHMGTGTTEQS